MLIICTRIYLVLFAVIVLLVAAETYNRSSEDWQYLVFSQRWPTTVCASGTNHKCQIPSYVSSWVIHGIWPTRSHDYPSYCNRSLTFNETVLKPIEDELCAVWPNLYSDQQMYAFWKHEWLKHGTCAVSLPQFGTELKYFTEAIREHNLYNILKYLEDSDITPDELTTYSMDRFKEAIESKIGKKALFQCKKVKGYENPLILALSICMDKRLALIDCPKKDSGCKSSVTYLPLRYTSTQPANFQHIVYITIGVILSIVAVISISIFVSSRMKVKRRMYTVLA